MSSRGVANGEGEKGRGAVRGKEGTREGMYMERRGSQSVTDLNVKTAFFSKETGNLGSSAPWEPALMTYASYVS